MVEPMRQVRLNANRALCDESLCTLAIGTSMLAAVQAQELSFTLHEQLIIGDDEEAPSEYLFYYPQIVRTDSQGNIYVKDARARTFGFSTRMADM